MSDSEQLRVGALIGGKYRIDRVLGQGGMGIVYAATHVGLEQKVALKFLLRAAAAHPEMIERFGREARAAVRIQSEHVARVLDVGTLDGDVPYIVMEFLEGESLEDVLSREGRFSASVAVDCILQACEALAEAHSLGIVHRDIKPGNLFRARRPGRSIIKVLDFGICKVPLDPKAIGITGQAAMMGSPGYMSPEQIFGAAEVDERTDVWALGAVLYHLVTGRPPFLADSMPALITAVLHRPHDSVISSTPNLPGALVAVIDACLAKDPAQRPANVAVLANALAAFGSPGGADVARRVADVVGVSKSDLPPAPSAMVDAMTQPSQPYATPAPERPIQVRETTLAPMTAPPSTRSTWRGTVLAIVAVVTGLAFGGFVVSRLIKPKAPAATAIVVSNSLPPVVSTPPPAAPISAEPVATATATAPPPAPSEAPAPPPKGSTTRPAHRPAAAPSASAAPQCSVVSYVDEQGDRHFKKVCP